MENNNMNEQQPNWQQALNEFSDQPQQPQQFAQQGQPQFNQYAQQAQPQFNQQAQPQQYAQQAQPQFNQQAQPQQFAQQGQPQFNQYAQQAQPQFNQQAQSQQYAQQGQPQFNQQAQFAQADGQYMQQGMPAYDAGSFAVVPPKKKSSALKIILIVLAAVIVVGGIPLALYFAGVFGKSGGGYETLEKNYFAAAEKKADEIFGGAKNLKTGIEQTFTISASKDVLGINADVAPTVIKATSYADTSAEKGSGMASLGAGSDEYLTVKYWMSGDKLYFTVPDLTEKYIVMDVNELASSMKDISSGKSDIGNILTLSDATDEMPSSSSGYEDILKSIDEETINKAIEIITDAYFKNFTATENKSDSLKVSDSTVNCTSYTIDFTAENIIAFCKDVLDAVEKESKIMDVLSQFGIDNASFQYLKTLVDDATKDATEDELKSVMATMIVYAKDNNIIGRKITISGEIEILLVTYSDNAQFDYSLTASISGDTLYAGAKGTVNGNNYTGTGSVTFNGETAITADYSFDATNGNGTYNLKVTTDDNENFEVKVNVAMDGNNGTFDIAVASNGTEVLSIKADSKEIAYVDEALPEVNDSNTVDINDSAALEQFSTEISANIPQLITKIQNVKTPDIVCYAFSEMIAAGGSF
ncbi:putative uncharacterized protein [[Eubacterium] siraeum CAG:80]|uniref:Uncharacterized protein n=1 Tax=[Eubacterium] siraeum CAG:80 TaxID=1263080 RepID=R6SDP2_9FIRM|nr:putative uncharacterized protein [[Eubacterium] siraeum CAG:80]